ncbi:hypothetical protein AB5I41_08950 [Sphingomonas sp. MMS24-JH45]
MKAAAKLPGVNFQSADAFGAYEWSTRISLRGFNQNQLGFTLDYIPLGDMSYGNVNGLHISRAIIAENIATTTVAQGAGALGTASTSNLGGTLQFTSRTPSDTADLVASGTYGSNDTIRAFVRAESGDLGGGLKGYLYYGYLTTDKWKGSGSQRQHQVNAKIVKEIGSLGSITAFADFSDRRESDYQDLSYDIIARRGLRADNISNDYPLALTIARVYQNQTARAAYAAANGGSTTGFVAPWTGAGFTFPTGFGTVDDAYYDAAELRQDYLGGVTFDARLTPGAVADDDQFICITTRARVRGSRPIRLRPRVRPARTALRCLHRRPRRPGSPRRSASAPPNTASTAPATSPIWRSRRDRTASKSAPGMKATPSTRRAASLRHERRHHAQPQRARLPGQPIAPSSTASTIPRRCNITSPTRSTSAI